MKEWVPVHINRNTGFESFKDFVAPIYEGSLCLECVRVIPPNTEIITYYCFSQSCFHPSGQCLSSKSPPQKKHNPHIIKSITVTFCLFISFRSTIKHWAVLQVHFLLSQHSQGMFECRGAHFSWCHCISVTSSKKRALEFPVSQK